MTLASEVAQEIVDEFLFFDDWEDRYKHLIDLGRKLDPLDDKYKIEANEIRGCQAEVHFVAKYDAPLLHFSACANADIVQGLVALLLRVYSGRTPEDILGTPADFLGTIGLDEHLSPTRKNGLALLYAAIIHAANKAKN